MDSSAIKTDGNSLTQNKDEDDYFQTFCNETTLHGARFLTSGNKAIRFLWVVFICGALAFCCYYIHGISREYMARPFTTTITRERADELEFPAVTICNLNPISKKSYVRARRSSNSDPSKQTNQTDTALEEEVQMLVILMQSHATRDISQKSKNLFSSLNASKKYNEKGFGLLEGFKNYSHTIQGMLVARLDESMYLARCPLYGRQLHVFRRAHDRSVFYLQLWNAWAPKA